MSIFVQLFWLFPHHTGPLLWSSAWPQLALTLMPSSGQEQMSLPLSVAASYPARQENTRWQLNAQHPEGQRRKLRWQEEQVWRGNLCSIQVEALLWEQRRKVNAVPEKTAQFLSLMASIVLDLSEDNTLWCAGKASLKSLDVHICLCIGVNKPVSSPFFSYPLLLKV